MKIWNRIFRKKQSAALATHASQADGSGALSKEVQVEKMQLDAMSSSPAYRRGKDFERGVEVLLRRIESAFPASVTVTPQENVKLFDGRTKVIDFAFDYALA